ncbi:hypothetical protein DZE40_002340 [Clostridium beijerinckii]|uniref:Peptidase C39 domain-containing protein n=1 Tax=Clostridium beijerinckii TaxID=1520 RepID=A0A1S8S942_CLOBE|nr:hypothetical protein [Clostridium beijerinckii]OOM61877.1 hypothetical protein CLBCK_20520 [Clostridium beijerinckii]
MKKNKFIASFELSECGPACVAMLIEYFVKEYHYLNFEKHIVF